MFDLRHRRMWNCKIVHQCRMSLDWNPLQWWECNDQDVFCKCCEWREIGDKSCRHRRRRWWQAWTVSEDPCCCLLLFAIVFYKLLLTMKIFTQNCNNNNNISMPKKCYVEIETGRSRGKVCFANKVICEISCSRSYKTFFSSFSDFRCLVCAFCYI